MPHSPRILAHFGALTLILAACDSGDTRSKEATKTSAPTPQPSGDKMPIDPAKPNAPSTTEPGDAPLPTDEEKAEAPLEAYVSVVPEPSLTSKLPCPPGTTQSVGDNVIECRIAGKVGESLSKRQGPSVWFHPNGKVQRAGNYEAHEWSGRWWNFDDQGRPESSTAYVAGKEEGLSVGFHPNGRRRFETFYKAGKMEGPSKSWTEDGELMGITVYKDNAVVSSKVFRYTLKEATPAEIEKSREELRVLLEEQKRALDQAK